MNATTRGRVAEHGRRLLRIFPGATEPDPIRLYRRLRRLEVRATRAAEAYCNGTIDDDAMDHVGAEVLAEVRAVLGPSDAPIFVNRDPRGYALKIEPGWSPAVDAVVHRDWGGYVIIAPDLG